MNIDSQLLEHIVQKNEYFFLKVSEHRFENLKESDDLQDPVRSLFEEDFTYLYIPEFLNQLTRIYYEQKYALQKDLSFFKDSQSKNDYISNEIHKYKKEYDSNEYNFMFTVDNFHNEFFEIRTLDSLIENLITEYQEEIYGLYEYDPRSQVNLEELDIILSVELNEILRMAEILISLKLIYIEQQNDKKENIFQGSSLQTNGNGKLTFDQKNSEKKAFKKPNPYALVFSSPLTFELFMYCLRDYKKDYLTPPLFVKYFYLFKQEKYIIGDKSQHYSDFVIKEFNVITPTRFRDKLNSEPEETHFFNSIINFQTANDINSIE